MQIFVLAEQACALTHGVLSVNAPMQFFMAVFHVGIVRYGKVAHEAEAIYWILDARFNLCKPKHWRYHENFLILSFLFVLRVREWQTLNCKVVPYSEVQYLFIMTTYMAVAWFTWKKPS